MDWNWARAPVEITFGKSCPSCVQNMSGSMAATVQIFESVTANCICQCHCCCLSVLMGSAGAARQKLIVKADCTADTGKGARIQHPLPHTYRAGLRLALAPGIFRVVTYLCWAEIVPFAAIHLVSLLFLCHVLVLSHTEAFQNVIWLNYDFRELILITSKWKTAQLKGHSTNFTHKDFSDRNSGKMSETQLSRLVVWACRRQDVTCRFHSTLTASAIITESSWKFLFFQFDILSASST